MCNFRSIQKNLHSPPLCRICIMSSGPICLYGFYILETNVSAQLRGFATCMVVRLANLLTISRGAVDRLRAIGRTNRSKVESTSQPCAI